MSQTIAQDATNVILQAKLSPIEHKLLVDFIEQATDHDVAAQDVLRRVASRREAGGSVEEALRELKADWHKLVATVASSKSNPTHSLPHAQRDLVYRRDRSRCCLKSSVQGQDARPEPTFIISPSVAHALEPNSVSRGLMDAFLTPAGASRLLGMLLDTSDQGVLVNSWLLTPAVSGPFRNRHLCVRPYGMSWDVFDEEVGEGDEGALKAKYTMMRLYPEPYQGIIEDDGYAFDGGPCVLQTETQQLPLPSWFLFCTHSKLVHALHHFRIEKSIARGWPPQTSSFFLSPRVQLIARNIWLLLPKFIRTLGYSLLIDIGRSRYPQDISAAVHRLPLGLYAKRCDRTGDNEPNALRLLEREAPSIPAPRLIDTFVGTRAAREGGGPCQWLIMTRMPGVRVQDVLYRMSYAERDQLADDLSNILAKMHRIQNKTPYLFANVSGGPIFDRRASGPGGCGPYNTEADLNAQLAKGVEKYLRQDMPTAFSRTHKSVFSHSDLFFSNVLVEGGRLSGIVGWENAAFMPEYWDFTKAMRASSGDKDAEAIYRHIWGHKFDEELETEMWLWRVFPFGGA